MRKILEENRKRRAPKDQYIQLEGREWRVEGFGEGSNIYLDRCELSQGVTVRRVQDAVVSVPKKVAHVMLTNVKNTKVRVKGVISSIEMVHCDNIDLELRGSVPVLQIDLCRVIRVLFSHEGSRPKLVNANNQDISCFVKGGSEEDMDVIPTSLFAEQFVTYWKKNEETNKWEMESKSAKALKDKGGFINLSGVAGSNADLLGMEQQAKKEEEEQDNDNN